MNMYGPPPVRRPGKMPNICIVLITNSLARTQARFLFLAV